MRQEDLLDAIGSVEESRLARTEKKSSARLRLVHIGSAVAACLAVCVIAASVFPSVLASLSAKSSSGSASSDYVNNSYNQISNSEYNTESADGITNDLFYAYADENKLQNEEISPQTPSYESESSLSQPESIQDAAEQKTDSPQTTRKLITTMRLSIEAEEYDSVTAWIEQQTASLNGYVQSMDTFTRYDNLRYASYTLRIPAESLSAFAEGVGTVGNITASSSETQDITLTYVDIQSHIRSLETEQDRLMELLAQAESLTDMLEIEDRLSYVRYELESYRSQLLLYDNQVTYSTLYLDISEVTAYTEPEAVTFGERVRSGFVRNLSQLSETVTDSLVFVLSNLPTILTVSVIAAATVLLVCRIRSRIRTRQKKH